MKYNDQTQPSQLKPISVSKSKSNASKTEKKKALVALRLSMLEEDTNAISNSSYIKQERLTPEATPQPLAMIKPSRIKRSTAQRSKERSNSSAMKRAEEVQASLSAEYPSLVKYMLHSHTASGFWLGLSKEFCFQHLPSSDTMMELIDESGKIFQAKYLAAKVGLSGGWRGFSIAHKLEEGDVVVFQLVKSTTFKIYIIRRNALGETDGALGLINLDTCANAMTSNNGDKDNRSEEQEKINSGSPSSEGHGSEVLNWIRLSEPDESVNLGSFENFRILIDGSVSIDAKFPDHIRKKYYNLCTNQNSSLHEKLLKGLNCTLVVGIINETINISDAVRSSNCITQIPQTDLLAWDRTLQSFELVGMNVRFIRMQIQNLLGQVIEQEETVVREAKMEKEITEERMKRFEVKLLELRKGMEEMDEEIKVMEDSTKRKRLKLQQMENSSSCGGFGSSLV